MLLIHIDQCISKQLSQQWGKSHKMSNNSFLYTANWLAVLMQVVSAGMVARAGRWIGRWAHLTLGALICLCIDKHLHKITSLHISGWNHWCYCRVNMHRQCNVRRRDMRQLQVRFGGVGRRVWEWVTSIGLWVVPWSFLDCFALHFDIEMDLPHHPRGFWNTKDLARCIHFRCDQERDYGNCLCAGCQTSCVSFLI